MRIVKKSLQASVANLIPINLVDEQDSRSSIIQNLIQRSSTVVIKDLKDIITLNGELCFHGNVGMLGRVFL